MIKILLFVLFITVSLYSKEGLYKMSDCYGKTNYTRFNPDDIFSIEPANCSDRDNIKVFIIITKRYNLRSYMLNEKELASIINTDEAIKRDMKAQEIQMLRKQLMLNQ